MDCNLCGCRCNIDRIKKRGKCKCGENAKLALATLHYWEEPCISGKSGSGTVFFTGCNMNCKFCQNYKISQGGVGKDVTDERLAEIFIELQGKGANNINLVSPTPYVYNIIEAIKIARCKGLKIPIVYNTNGYDTPETVKLLDGYIDIYLPDLKYYIGEASFKLSNCKDYFEVASSTILEMSRQVGEAKFDENGMMQRGLMIRHLILPNYVTHTKNLLNWIENNLGLDTYISIMTQYFPTYKAKDMILLNRKISIREYEYVRELISPFKNGYIQDLGEFEEEYVPEFDLSGI